MTFGTRKVGSGKEGSCGYENQEMEGKVEGFKVERDGIISTSYN
jgi:hypothetical protein